MSEEAFEAIEADVASYMERRFPVGESTSTALSVTGEPYIVLCCGGQGTGEISRVVATDAERAAALFKAEFDKYASNKDGVLYWRMKPSVSVQSYRNEVTGGADSYYQVRARFLISSNAKEVQ